MFYKISFLALILSFTTMNASSILDDFWSQGYHEMLNEYCGQDYFAEVYTQLDLLDNFINKHPEWAKVLYEIDLEYIKSKENSLYGSPPIGYVNDTKSGKNKKTYFHFTDDYFKLINNKYPELISGSKEFESLLKSLRNITKIGKQKFEEAIKSISSTIDLSKVLYTNDGKLLILTKVVRYDPSDVAASNPHFDFSGLSFLFDNNENDECESLLIAPYKEDLTTEDFFVPTRKHKKDASKSSLLLIPGLALQHLNLPINPTPHAVLKQNKKRYAIIVFAMTPNTKLSYDEIKLRKIKLPDLTKP